jgi:large-conductance mechanosensitive channel
MKKYAHMGGSTSNTTRVLLDTRTNIVQATTNTCQFICSNNFNNVTIVIIDSTVGDINLNQTCSVTNASCMIKTSTDAYIKNILDVLITQTAKTDSTPFGNFSYSSAHNDLEISEFIENNLTQLVSNNCQVKVSNTNSGMYVYISGSTVKDLNFSQVGAINDALCSMESTSKAVVWNQETAKGDQTAEVSCCGCSDYFGMIVTIVIVIVVGSVIITIAFMVVRSVNASAKNKEKNEKNNSRETPEDYDTLREEIRLLQDEIAVQA